MEDKHGGAKGGRTENERSTLEASLSAREMLRSDKRSQNKLL